jgi:transcriptional regulator CtsR
MKNSQILSHRFFKRLLAQNNSDVVNIRYQSIHKSFSTRINILVTRSLTIDPLAGD